MDDIKRLETLESIFKDTKEFMRLREYTLDPNRLDVAEERQTERIAELRLELERAIAALELTRDMRANRVQLLRSSRDQVEQAAKDFRDAAKAMLDGVEQ